MSNTNQIKEVIIHVGLPKTGSSSIQKTLYNQDNNTLLQDAGLLYPRCWGQNHGPILKGAISDNPERYFSARWHQVVSKEQIEEFNRLNLEKLKTSIQNYLKRKKKNKLLFSGEQLSRLPAEVLMHLKTYIQKIGLNPANITINLYTRDPVSWAGSMAQQKLKEGFSYESMINKEIPAIFLNRIGNFVSVFGAEAVQVHSFEKAREHEMGLVGHLLEESGINRETIGQIEQFRANESISMFTGGVLAYIQKKVPMRIKGKPNPKRERNDYKPLQKIRGDKFTLSHEEKQRIQSNAAEGMTWLKENYQIDYTQNEIKDEEKYKHIGASLEDVEHVYPKLTKVLRQTLIEFMENQLITEIPSDYKNQCQHVIQNLKGQEYQIMQQEITKLNKEVKKLKKEKKATQTKLNDLLNSKSWKMTSPLRKTMEIVSGKK